MSTTWPVQLNLDRACNEISAIEYVELKFYLNFMVDIGNWIFICELLSDRSSFSATLAPVAVFGIYGVSRMLLADLPSLYDWAFL